MTQRLFRAHLQDLHSLQGLQALGISDGMFVCPICGNQYSQANNQLTIGHVWPDAVRGDNPSFCQEVLLCKYCNNTAGSRGDAQIGRAIEEAKAHASREFPERRVVFRPHENPRELLRINASILILDAEEGSKGKITFSPSRNDPASILRLKSQEKFDVQIDPHPLLRPGLIKAGWVTSAFLFAFYSLGYRYMLSAAAEQVRNYVWSSFSDDEPTMPEGIFVGTLSEDAASYLEPQILISIPLNLTDLIVLKIRAQRTLIALPLPFNPEVLRALLWERKPEIFEATTGKIRRDFPHNWVVEIPIRCTKIQPHGCVFDDILGH